MKIAIVHYSMLGLLQRIKWYTILVVAVVDNTKNQNYIW